MNVQVQITLSIHNEQRFMAHCRRVFGQVMGPDYSFDEWCPTLQQAAIEILCNSNMSLPHPEEHGFEFVEPRYATSQPTKESL